MEVSRRKAVAFPKETFLTCWGPCGDRLFFPESERERGGGELERGRLLPYASSRHRMGNDTWLSTSSRSQILRVFTVYIYKKKSKVHRKDQKKSKFFAFSMSLLTSPASACSPSACAGAAAVQQAATQTAASGLVITLRYQENQEPKLANTKLTKKKHAVLHFATISHYLVSLLDLCGKPWTYNSVDRADRSTFASTSRAPWMVRHHAGYWRVHHKTECLTASWEPKRCRFLFWLPLPATSCLCVFIYSACFFFALQRLKWIIVLKLGWISMQKRSSESFFCNRKLCPFMLLLFQLRLQALTTPSGQLRKNRPAKMISILVADICGLQT